MKKDKEGWDTTWRILMGFSVPVKEKDMNSINAQGCRLQTKRAREKMRTGRVSVFVQLKKRFDVTMCK